MHNTSTFLNSNKASLNGTNEEFFSVILIWFSSHKTCITTIDNILKIILIYKGPYIPTYE